MTNPYMLRTSAGGGGGGVLGQVVERKSFFDANYFN